MNFILSVSIGAWFLKESVLLFNFHTYRISFPLLFDFDHTYFRYCIDDDVEHRNVCLPPINSLVYFVYSFIEIT